MLTDHRGRVTEKITVSSRTSGVNCARAHQEILTLHEVTRRAPYPMELTKEQLDIIHSTGNIKINAVAGSGKTTTVIEYARSRPAHSKILYLAFNKAVRLEAAKKFADKGLHHVHVETAHSLAYKHIVRKNNYRLKPLGYDTTEVVETLHIKGNDEKHTEYVIANHINKFVSYFCNSDKRKTEDLNYLDIVTEEKARAFVSSFHEYIISQSKRFLAKMHSGEIEITHDFYLKKFQLSNPVLPYDYILFDEGQDASPAMLDIFFNQKATKVIVGDTHQQIYGWRFAVNSLEKAEYKTYQLSTSFRFSQVIADLAKEALKLKRFIREQPPSIAIIGKGNSTEEKTKAVLARTNLGLLVKAIRYVTEKKKVKHIYFEGNFNSYAYADEGASLYDVLNLFNQKRHLIRNKLIKAMEDLEELEEYIEKTEDLQLGMMVEIVKEYGNEIPNIINAIKEKHVEKDEKEKAEMIFSTVHRCKGMEYDVIQIVNDFISEKYLEKLKEDKQLEPSDFARINEEINLLYVAITRAKSSIYLPESLMPTGFPDSPQIRILKAAGGEKKEQRRTSAKSQPTETNTNGTESASAVDEAALPHREAYKSWTTELDDELTRMYCNGVNVKDMAAHFERTEGAITARIKKLELEDLYG